VSAARRASNGLPDIRERIRGTNINTRTLLATDYLNHFNEVMMLIELVPDDPDCLAEVVNWRPKTYREHFAASGLSAGALAIEAYEAADPAVRSAFEAVVEQFNAAIRTATYRLTREIDGADAGNAVRVAREAAKELRSLAEEMNALIQGPEAALDQTAIDQILDQAAIDKMF
jgi:hypothetical protein